MYVMSYVARVTLSPVEDVLECLECPRPKKPLLACKDPSMGQRELGKTAREWAGEEERTSAVAALMDGWRGNKRSPILP
jgi:hypothetical protein